MTTTITGPSPVYIATLSFGVPYSVYNHGESEKVFLATVGQGQPAPAVTADNTSTGGYPLLPATALTPGVASGIDGTTLVDLYGIVPSGTAYVSVLAL